MASLRCVLLLLAVTGSFAAPTKTPNRVVVVTGATGRTGSLAYFDLKATAGFEVRALVTNITDAARVLNCSKCDATEGIFLGDVADAKSLAPAMAGATDLAIAVGLGPGATPKVMHDVTWKGVENQVAALAAGRPQGMAVGELRVVLVSSMGTTNPNPPAYEGGKDLFFKLQAEAFLMSAGVGFTVIKPCGLSEKRAGEAELVAGHDDTNLGILFHSVGRADVAAVMVAALTERTTGLRVDLCSRPLLPGRKPTEPKALLESAKWSFQL